MQNEEEKDMAIAANEEVDVKKSLVNSLNEVNDIRSGKLPKRSYKEMMKRIRENLKDNK